MALRGVGVKALTWVIFGCNMTTRVARDYLVSSAVCRLKSVAGRSDLVVVYMFLLERFPARSSHSVHPSDRQRIVSVPQAAVVPSPLPRSGYAYPLPTP